LGRRGDVEEISGDEEGVSVAVGVVGGQSNDDGTKASEEAFKFDRG